MPEAAGISGKFGKKKNVLDCPHRSTCSEQRGSEHSVQ